MGNFIEIIEEDESFSKKIGDSTLHGRRISTQKIREIQKRHTKYKRNRQTGLMVPETDEGAVDDDMIDYALTGWENVVSPVTGQPVECTREIKLKLPTTVKTEFIEESLSENISGKK